MRTEFLCISVLRVASGPRVKLASCKSALKPPVVYSTDRSKAVVPVLVLLFVALRFILRGRFVVSVCHFVLVFFSPFSIAITSFGEERANLSAFRTFVRFVLIWICRFPLPLGVWEGLRFVIVALPGLFSYFFLLYFGKFFFFFFRVDFLGRGLMYRKSQKLITKSKMTADLLSAFILL